MTSGYSPIGAMIASDRLFEPFNDGTTTFVHGYTFGGHPVSSAVALANLDIFEREGINDHVKQNAPAFRATLEKLLDLPIVGDVRGEGFFYGIELVKDKATKAGPRRRAQRMAAAQLPVHRAVRGRPVLPRRRPRRLGSAAGAAADQWPGRVRRDRADSAWRAHPGMGPPADPWRGLEVDSPACRRRHASRRSIPSGGRRRRWTRCRSSGRRRSRSSPFRVMHPRTSSSTPTAASGPASTTAASCASHPTARRRSSATPAAARSVWPWPATAGCWSATARAGYWRWTEAAAGFETLVDEVDGRRLQFCSNVTETADGTIYFTESTSAFTYADFMGAILEARGRGSLFRRDPDGTVLTIVPGLYFANGVTLTADGSALVFAELLARRLSKYWLTGPKAGSVERVRREPARHARQPVHGRRRPDLVRAS